MGPGKWFSILALFVAGCLSPVTKRLECTNEQLAITNQHLAAINDKLRETNERTIEMSQHLMTANAQLRETNRRLQAIEKGLPRLPRLGAEQRSIPPLANQAEAIE